VSAQTTLPKPWAALARRLGGVGKLAEALGVTPRTVARWGCGVLPQPIVQQYVVDFAKKHGVSIVWRESASVGKRRRKLGTDKKGKRQSE